MTFEAARSILPTSADSRDGELQVGGVGVRALADAYGTPVIVYDEDHVRASAQAWLDAFDAYEPGVMVAYASKAFTSVGMLRILGELGLGADVSSLGELTVALRAGIDPARIVLHGNNKSREELVAAVDAEVGLVVLDAMSELELLEEVAAAAGRPVPVLVRINPDLVVETHRYISTSHAGSKFGVPGAEAVRMLERATASAHLDPLGVHVHLGSQLLDTAPWHDVVDWLGAWAADLREATGIQLQVLDIGGGLGIAYTAEQHPPTVESVARRVVQTLQEAWASRDLALPRLVVEPGRSIVGQAAVTVYEVGVVKGDAGDGIRYVNVDGGMSDNPRPMLYQARYSALLGERTEDPDDGRWWVAGVHCESGDVLIEDAALPEPRRGDLLVVPATGAYAASMASTYNMVPRCAVAIVRDGQHRALLARETMEQLLARDIDA